jgi:hypothetical protein
MVYPADDTQIRLALLRRELRATMERVRALVEDGQRKRAMREKAAPDRHDALRLSPTKGTG